MYSETAQDIFDRLYDEYYTIIDQIKQWKQIMITLSFFLVT
jgi:hypothetical protein